MAKKNRVTIKEMSASNTVQAGVVGLAGAVAMWYSGDKATAVQTAITCLLAIFLRKGMMK